MKRDDEDYRFKKRDIPFGYDSVIKKESLLKIK